MFPWEKISPPFGSLMQPVGATGGFMGKFFGRDLWDSWDLRNIYVRIYTIYIRDKKEMGVYNLIARLNNFTLFHPSLNLGQIWNLDEFDDDLMCVDLVFYSGGFNIKESRWLYKHRTAVFFGSNWIGVPKKSSPNRCFCVERVVTTTMPNLDKIWSSLGRPSCEWFCSLPLWQSTWKLQLRPHRSWFPHPYVSNNPQSHGFYLFFVVFCWCDPFLFVVFVGA